MLFSTNLQPFMLKIPYSDAVVTKFDFIPWTTSEVVLMNMHNPTVIDAICSCLNIDSLLALSTTCSKGRTSWVAYKKCMFNIIKMLSMFLKDIEGFRKMQRKTGALIISDAAWHYFTRSDVRRSILDIAVHATHTQTVVHQLKCVEVFSVWGDDHAGQEFESTYSEEYTESIHQTLI